MTEFDQSTKRRNLQHILVTAVAAAATLLGIVGCDFKVSEKPTSTEVAEVTDKKIKDRFGIDFLGLGQHYPWPNHKGTVMKIQAIGGSCLAGTAYDTRRPTTRDDGSSDWVNPNVDTSADIVATKDGIIEIRPYDDPAKEGGPERTLRLTREDDFRPLQPVGPDDQKILDSFGCSLGEYGLSK